MRRLRNWYGNAHCDFEMTRESTFAGFLMNTLTSSKREIDSDRLAIKLKTVPKELTGNYLRRPSFETTVL